MSQTEIREKIRQGELKEQEYQVEISNSSFEIQKILLERKKLNFALNTL